MKLAYRAIDVSGKEVGDSIEAASPKDATEKLRQRGLFVTSVTEAPDGAAATAKPSGRTGQGRRLKNVALFARQLSVLVRTGTPLVDSLRAIERQLPPGPWRAVVASLHRYIEEGTALAVAMERHPDYFDGVCRSLVAAGESSGKLDAMLQRLAHLVQQQLKIRRTVIGALIYPLLLSFIGVAVVVVMLVFVLPRFEGLFETLDAPLPPSTNVLLVLSEVLRAQWWVFVGLLLAAGVGAGFALATEGGQRLLDVWVVRAPSLGRISQSLMTARFARLLGVLLESQVPLIEALRLTRQSTGNHLYAALIGESEEAVVRGETLSGVLAQSSLISPYVSEAIRHGEESGQVSPVLMDMADFLDEENEVLVKTLSKLLEPIMLVLLGIVVGFIAMSLFMPLFDLTSLTQGA